MVGPTWPRHVRHWRARRGSAAAIALVVLLVVLALLWLGGAALRGAGLPVGFVTFVAVAALAVAACLVQRR